MAPRKNKKKTSGVVKPAEEEVVSSKRPLKRLKKANVGSESAAEEVVSSKRPLKRLKKASIASESTPKEASPDEKTVDAEKNGDAKEPVPTPKVRKPCTWLKLDRLDPKPESKCLPSPKLETKSLPSPKPESKSHPNPKQAKEVKPAAQVRTPEDNRSKRNNEHEEKVRSHPATNDKKNSRHERKEKEITEEVDDKFENELGGLIFMCNAKTKPDCFRYQLMGVPAHKKEVVMNMKPGLKFFLYDYDLKVLYGVFEASSTGGMKLEPTAFGGAFPAQVRFAVYKECLPLPESVFKKAIKDSYDEKKRKFKTELTVRQVRKLIGMFNPAPSLHRNGKSAVREQMLYPITPVSSWSEESFMRPRHLIRCGNADSQGTSDRLHSPVPPRDLLFLSEEEYRSNGLQRGRHTDNVRPYKLDVELKNLLRNPASTRTDSPLQQREINRPRDPLYPSEAEYRNYGLRNPHPAPNPASPVVNRHNPYDEDTTSIVNRYLSLPMTSAAPAESYPPIGREPYTSDRAFPPHNFQEQSVFNNQRSYSLAPTEAPELSRGGAFLHRKADLTSAPVSHRYSFAGPSLSQHR